MSRGLLLAEFRDPETLLDAARRARDAGLRGLDAHTPFAVEGLTEALGLGPTRIRRAMLIGGVLSGAFTYWLQWYSAVVDYPINSGGRPLFNAYCSCSMTPMNAWGNHIVSQPGRIHSPRVSRVEYCSVLGLPFG